MWYNSVEHPTTQSKNYFLGQKDTIICKKMAEAYKRFNMSNCQPNFNTVEEAIDWFKDRDVDSFNKFTELLNVEDKRIERTIVASNLSETDYDYERDDDANYNIIIDAIENLEAWDWTPPAKVTPLPERSGQLLTEDTVALAA